MTNPQDDLTLNMLALGPFQMNCYIIACDKTREVVVIDPGDEIQKILHLIKEKDYLVKIVALTHAHIDHAGRSASFMKEMERQSTGLNLPIFMHESELKIYQNLSLQSRMFGYSTGEPWPNIQFLKDQAEIQFGNSHVLQVLHTPGHSPGSLGFHSKEGRFLIAGDVLFKGSIGRTDLWEGDFKTLIHSIQNRILSLPPDTRIFPGHGPDTTVGIEKNSNPFLNQ